MNECTNSPINPKASEDFNSRGIELGQQGKMAEAAQYFQKAISLNPGNITAYSNLGVILAHYGQFAEARQCFAQAIALDPNNAVALTNDALILLLHCQFAEGWLKYEHRPCLKNGGELKNLWNGSPIPNQILLVIHEQGSGDTIQFIRYLPIIRKLCGKLIFLCPPPMKSLLNGFPGVDVLTDTVGTGIECHASIELIGLPRIVNTTAETIPADVPYLSASPEKAACWKKTIVKDKLNVGLAWAGNPKNVVDWKRSLHLSDFAPLANPGIVFHSLQVAHRSEEAEQPPAGMRLENPAKDFADFSDTAGMIENLDLVIAVDTAVAHLSGAMGKPVWILLPFSPDWRWMLNREDSPWYPTARLFRQPQPENWAAVIQRVADELNRIVLQKAAELRRQAAACLRENKQKDALVLAQAAISFKPDYADAHFIRGYVLQSSDNMSSAEESFRVVVSAKPELAEAHYGLGLSLQAQGKPKEAMECYQRVLALNPKHVNTYNNLGNLFAHYGELEKARECFARIRMIDPKDTLSLAYQALLLLLEGHFAEGWEKYEFRPSLYETSVRKKWDGSDMPDQTVMVLHEQGIGDTIQFIRYLPIVRERCKKLVFVCHRELISLITGFPGIDILTDDPLGIEYHAAIPLLSIPGVLKTTIETIPNKVPYLSAPPEKAALWKKTMSADKLNIGLVWAGNSKHLADWKRSLHLCDFAPLANSGVVFHSLQVAHRSEEAEQPPEGMKIENPAKDFNDFSDTAAIIENLDLVISVDTAAAHLAGAMGKPVWILLPFSPDWRWMLNREDSPWYPTARLFRQSQPDVWTDVIQRVADELKRLVSNRIFKRGFALHSQKKNKEAIECYQQVIAVNPRHAITHNNLGFIYLQNGQFDKAKEHFTHALEIDPNYGSALFNQSLILLLEGNFGEGWQKYEHRPSLDKDILQKKWDGSPLENKTLLAVYEQGMGDSIQFMRYLPIVRQLCEKLIFICHADLKPLINFPGIEVLANDQARTIQCDAVIQLLSIPAVLNTTIETIPANIPYISAIPQKAAHWKSAMISDKLNVGLVWAGNPNHLADAKRSLHLSDFAPLAHPGVVFHSLQVAHRAEEAENPPEGMTIENPAKNIVDFSDTAAIIENLDLVISVDTAVAHLAGAMGKPVWILLPFSPDWRWMLNREDSPWYPTARLFRQSQADVWTDVIQRVADELSRLISKQIFKKGFALQSQNKTQEAIKCYQQVIVINPKHAIAHNNLGFIYLQNGEYAKANKYFVRALEIDPNYGSALFNQSLILLLEGNFREGWQKRELRLRLSLHDRGFQNIWDGSAIPNKILLVKYQGGFGDTLHFIRYLPIIRKRCGKLIFVCQPELIPLINGFTGIDILTTDQNIEYDKAIELSSIPVMLNTTLDTIPNKVPYLFANPEKTAVWKKTIYPDNINVGLVWSGSPQHMVNWKRALHLSDFAPLIHPGVVFHSLQVGDRAEEAEQPPNGMKIENPAKNIVDFSDTAAIIENLDLVISVDTAVAHLAGAMGKPVWILLPFSPDWRWMLNREDSPWYPTACLFRQSQLGNWAEVILRVADELKRLVSNRIFKRGFALQSQNKNEEAIKCYQQALVLNPKYVDAHNNLGVLLQYQQKYKEAAECYQQALALNPKYVDAYNNLGNLFVHYGQFEKAQECYAHIRTIDPNNAKSLFHEALLLLLKGNFSQGWEKYEYRPSRNNTMIQKRWNGSAMPDQTIMVLHEQGFGDTIQFIRYLPIVRSYCQKLVFVCQAQLKFLISGFPGIDVLMDNSVTAEVQCHAAIELLSIPGVLKTTMETIPKNVPYLSANPEKAALWKKTMSADKLNVGLVWAGNPNHLADAKRSLHLSDFAPLAHPGVVFHSLQVAHRAEEAEHPPEGMRLENPAKNIVDFSDTAAIIENLDLVISVDTAVAHLAGAMGKPVWILLPFSPDWRWMLNREDSPWYPTARLFRQSQADVWTDVLQRVAGALNHIVAHRAAGFYQAATNLIRENKLNEALALNNKAISVKPDYPDVVFNQGYIFKLMGNHKASEESFRRFIELKPDHAEAYLGIGLALQEQGKPKEAEEYYRQALVLNPNHTEVYLALGNALKDLGRTDEAIESYHRTLRITPNHVEGWKGFGMALKEQGKMQQALTCYEKALSLDPKNIETWISIGNLKKAMGDISGSIETYRQTIRFAPDEGRVHSFLALALLLRGEFDEGWKEYEWRWEIEPLSAVKRHYSAPRWAGEPLNGKRIFLYGEQGFGDILQFVRYVSLLKEMGARIFLECYQELLPLVSRMSAIDAVVVPNHPIPAFDYHCPLMSLPYIFKTRLESIPAPVSYLSACPEKIAHWKKTLCTLHFAPPTLKVGIIWAGNPSHKKDRERSIPLCRFAPILNTPGVKFFSLQVGGRAKDIQESCAFGDIVDLSPELKDFDDTAAVMSVLDLIISVDTASAHLAGALGRPVWIMLQFSPDFRWLWGREDSPWYPSARLFRQPEHNCWEPVIRQIATELTDLTPQSLA